MANVEKLRKNLEANGFKTSYFAAAAEAADYLCSEIRGTSVGFGGSMTLDSMGLYERLGEHNEVAWHWKGDNKAAAYVKAAEAEVYLSSANGVAETGEIINIDATGNRVAETLYGKKKVYIVIGSNKIEPTLEKAIHRARNIAAPLNARRFGLATPCATGNELRCYDCHHPQRICKGVVVFLQKMKGVGECEVVIVDEALGY